MIWVLVSSVVIGSDWYGEITSNSDSIGSFQFERSLLNASDSIFIFLYIFKFI
ncbi:hypothetical protein [Bizionia psychrotolerans]|uniref:hypothetical protein n=1 Tax=Bizionia psychrotolerans TaxID=1492901 RepID=UPI0012E0AB51|nr:hypothetical protein [Bizionia psychrotolerans]